MKTINPFYSFALLGFALFTPAAFAEDTPCDIAFKNSSANHSCWYNGYYTTQQDESCNYNVDCPANSVTIDKLTAQPRVSSTSKVNKITVPLLQAACLKNRNGILVVECF